MIKKYSFILSIVTCLSTGLAIQTLQAEETAPAVANFTAADADKSGGLSSAEFKTFIDSNAEAGLGNAKKIQSRGLYDRAFAKIDKDKDGEITMAEFESMKK